MWIGSLKENKTKPLGIKWPDEPIKALCVYYSYDQKLLHEKNFIEKLDSVKKLVNIWPSRGLSLNKIVNYPKICLCVVIIDHSPGSDPRAKPTVIQIFMERGRQSQMFVSNDYKKSGLKMIDLKTMVKSLRFP